MPTFQPTDFVLVRLRDLPAPSFSEVDVVAHDLRNVLTTISGNTELLDANAIVSSEARRKVLLACRRAESLLQHLSNPTQPGANFDPALVLSKAAAQLHGLVHPGAELDIQILSSRYFVRGCPDSFERIVFNLVVNASEAFASERGKISVTLRSDGIQSVLEVVDDGPGLDMLCLHDHFTCKFSTKRPGSGLGLPIVAEAVNRLRGELRVASSDLGTAFQVLLPSDQSAIFAHTAMPAESLAPPLRKNESHESDQA